MSAGTVTVDIDQLRDLARRVSVSASWAGTGVHTRRIQAIADELLALTGDQPAAEQPPPDVPTDPDDDQPERIPI